MRCSVSTKRGRGYDLYCLQEFEGIGDVMVVGVYVRALTMSGGNLSGHKPKLCYQLGSWQLAVLH